MEQSTQTVNPQQKPAPVASPTQDQLPLAVFNAKIYERPARKILLWTIVGFTLSTGAKILAEKLARKFQDYNRAKSSPSA
jgi:hypothetical protein